MLQKKIPYWPFLRRWVPFQRLWHILKPKEVSVLKDVSHWICYLGPFLPLDSFTAGDGGECIRRAKYYITNGVLLAVAGESGSGRLRHCPRHHRRHCPLRPFVRSKLARPSLRPRGSAARDGTLFDDALFRYLALHTYTVYVLCEKL